MNILKLILIYITIFLLLYKLFDIVKYINKNDEKKIRVSRLNKIVINSMSTFLILLIYIKMGFVRDFYIYGITMIFMVLIGYIDYETSYIYEIITKPFLLFSVGVFILNIVTGRCTFEEIVSSLIAIVIVFIMAKTKCIGAGDIEVFAALFLIFSTYYLLPLIITMMSMAISGVGSIFLLICRKKELAYRKPLCPSIAIACYIIIILI